MGFSQAVISGFKNYVNFKGRATLPEFWWFALAVFIFQTVTSVISDLLLQQNLITVFVFTPGNVIFDSQTGPNPLEHDAANPIEALVLLAIALPLIAVTVRRLHDTGRKATSLLWFILPVVGHIVLAFELAEQSRPEFEGQKAPETFKRLTARRNWLIAILIVVIVNTIAKVGFVVTQCFDAVVADETYCSKISVMGSAGAAAFEAASIALIGYFIYRIAREKN